MLKNTLLFCLLTTLLACSQHPAPGVRTAQRHTSRGNVYSLFYPGQRAIQLVTSRPRPADGHCWLSVAAAYTDLATNQPLDLLVANGRLRQATATVGFLDGVLTIIGPTCTITRIVPGQVPPGAQLAKAEGQHGTLLLQELLVWQGQNQRPAGGAAFQRRALAEFAGHQLAVVESASDNLTLQQFGDELIELGAKNALYLDMGDWDEGWYRAGGQVVVLGHRRSQTARQSNWLVFVE